MCVVELFFIILFIFIFIMAISRTGIVDVVSTKRNLQPMFCSTSHRNKMNTDFFLSWIQYVANQRVVLSGLVETAVVVVCSYYGI